MSMSIIKVCPFVTQSALVPRTIIANSCFRFQLDF